MDKVIEFQYFFMVRVLSEFFDEQLSRKVFEKWLSQDLLINIKVLINKD